LIAVQCPLCQAYHPADRHLTLELMGKDDRPVMPGEMGRIVVTPLFNAAMPLLRYDTGDYAVERIGNRCPRSNRAIERILGRERNLFTLPNGRKVVPGLPIGLMWQLGVRRFKLLQTTLNEVEVHYIPRSGIDDIPAAEFQALMDRYMSCDLKVRALRVNEFSRSPSGKYLTHESLV